MKFPQAVWGSKTDQIRLILKNWGSKYMHTKF